MAFLKASDVLQGKVEMSQPKLCSCGCGKPLDPRVDGERQKINGLEVREDCYFNSLGKELDDFPIIMPRIRRRG